MAHVFSSRWHFCFTHLGICFLAKPRYQLLQGGRRNAWNYKEGCTSPFFGWDPDWYMHRFIDFRFRWHLQNWRSPFFHLNYHSEVGRKSLHHQPQYISFFLLTCPFLKKTANPTHDVWHCLAMCPGNMIVRRRLLRSSNFFGGFNSKTSRVGAFLEDVPKTVPKKSQFRNFSRHFRQ